MTTCKITETTPPPTELTPAERTFTLTLTGQELQHLRASMGNQIVSDYAPIVGEHMLDFLASLRDALQEAGIPVLSYPGGR